MIEDLYCHFHTKPLETQCLKGNRRLFGVPLMSQPFLKANLLDVAGLAIMWGVINPFAGVILRRLGATAEMIGLFSIAPFVGFLSTGIATRLAYRYRWGLLLALFSAIGRLTLLVPAFTASPVVFVGVFFIMHLFSSSAMSIHGPALKAHTRPGVRAGIFKWGQLLIAAVSIPIAWVSGVFLDVYPQGWRALFPLAGFSAACCALGYLRLPSRAAETNTMGQPTGLSAELNVLRKDRRFAVLMAILFIGFMGEKIGLPVLPIYFADVLDLKYEHVGAAIGIFGPILAVAGYFFWGLQLQKMSAVKVLTVCMIIKAARPVLWALAPSQPSPLTFIIVGEMIFRFCISGLEMAVILTVLGMSSERNAPAYMGVHYVLLGIRGLIGPIIGTILIKAGADVSLIYWIIAAVVMAGGTALILLCMLEKPAR